MNDLREFVVCAYHDVYMQCLPVAFGIERWVCMECEREEANKY